MNKPTPEQRAHVMELFSSATFLRKFFAPSYMSSLDRSPACVAYDKLINELLNTRTAETITAEEMTQLEYAINAVIAEPPP